MNIIDQNKNKCMCETNLWIKDKTFDLNNLSYIYVILVE